MSTENTINQLKQAAKSRDAKIAGRCVDRLRPAGHTYRDCYRIALAGDPTLTLAAWDDLMLEADSL